MRSQAAGQRVMASVTAFLEGKLRLKVNRQKSAVAPVGERQFLGHRLSAYGNLGMARSTERCVGGVLTHWQFVVDGKERSVPVSGRFSSSSVDGFLSACVSGFGLAQLSAWDAQDEVAKGRLVPVPIAGASPRDLAIWAVFPSRRQVLPKLRVFLERFKASLVWNNRGALP